jgi:HEAT repeat protein
MLARGMFQLRSLPRTLVAALRDTKDKKLQVRRSAIRDLVRLANGEERDAALSALCEVLASDEHAEARADAAIALADAEARSALDALLTAANEAHALVRQMAILALGELSPKGHKAACEAVEAALSADVAALRFQALIAANKLEVANSTSWLERGARDGDPKVRYLALRLIDQHLAQLGDAVAPASLLEESRKALADTELEVRVAAAFVHVRSGDARAGEALSLAINSGLRLPAPEDEQELIELAGEVQLGAAEPGLKRQAWGRFGWVPGRFAWQAKVALARLGNERARAEILRGLHSWDRDTRTHSVVAVGRAGLKEAIPVLEALGQAERADGAVIREALRELA